MTTAGVTAETVSQYLTETFAGVDLVLIEDGTFFFYNPDQSASPDRRFPFATLVTSDRFDRASNLDRPSVYRLNIGVRRETYRSLFGQEPAGLGPDGIVATGHDFTVLDQLLPHPVYAPQCWVCVLNPSQTTFQSIVQPLLAEAYGLAVSRHDRRAARG